MDLPTRPQLFEIGARDLLVRAETHPYGRRITAEQVYLPGSDVNLVEGGASIMAEEVMSQLGRGLADLTLDGASGAALDRVAFERTCGEVMRHGATPAWVTIQFTRTSTALGAVTQAAGTIVQTTGGVRFLTQADANLGATSLGPVSVVARAAEAGRIGNVQAGTVTGFVSAKIDTTLLVTNPSFAAGGDESESDKRLRARVRLWPKSTRRGTLEAVEFGALTIPGVVQATAYEELSMPLGVPNGFISLYLVDQNGQANAALAAAVTTSLDQYRGCGIWVTVYGGVPYYQAVELDLSYTAGTDTITAFGNVRQSVVAAINGLKPGQTLERSMIITAAKRVSGVIVYDDSIVIPAGDIVPTVGQVIRTKTSLVNPS